MTANKNILKFLEELRNNNNREWFNENKLRFSEIQNEIIALTDRLLSEIEKFDKSVMGVNPKDCIFRIYKDIRFSQDKTPYKTHLGIFMKGGGKKNPGSGYYLHIEPGNSMLGGGCYEPDPKSLQKIREAIIKNPKSFKTIIQSSVFLNEFGRNFYGEKLKTAPKGFAKDHPDIEYLKYKSFAVTKKIKDNDITSKNFMSICVNSYKIIYPLNQYLEQIILC